MTTGWFSGPGIGVLNGIFLRLDCTNDPLTAGLEINAATAGEPVLTLLTTDDNITNPYLDLTNSGTPMPYIMEKDGVRFLHEGGDPTNLFLGSGAGNFTVTGQRNLGVGYSSLRVVTSGYRNVGLGGLTLYDCTEGYYNMAIGYISQYELTTGDHNMGVGVESLRYNVIGDKNVAIGTFAGRGSVGNSHYNNVFIGYGSGYAINGDRNVGVGSETFVSLTTGQYSVAVGYRAGYSLITGSSCVFLGYQAGYNETNSNKLYISNSNTDQPLIYGEFDNELLRVWGAFEAMQSYNIICNNDTVVCNNDSVVVN